MLQNSETGARRTQPIPPALAYRLLVPRAAFFNFFLLEPRGAVRGALGAAFLRAARLSCFRSCLSSIFVVFAIPISFPGAQNLQTAIRRQPNI